MRRDLYAEVSARIIAELERGAAPWVSRGRNGRREYAMQCHDQPPLLGCNVVLLWLARDRGWPTPRFLTFKQAIEAGGNVRKGEHGTKVIFVKQLQVKEGRGRRSRHAPSPDAARVHGFQCRPMREPAR